MKTTIKNTLLALASVIIFTACQDVVRPSSRVTVQERNVTGFDGIEISSAFDVEVIYSTQETKVEIEVNENLHEHVEAELIGGNLRIRVKPGTSITGRSTLKARITTPRPTKNILASGASRVTLTNTLSTDNVDLYLSGASFLDGNIEADEMTIGADGASQFAISGQAVYITANLSGASFLNDFDFAVEVIDIALSGASNASLSIAQRITLDATGASVLQYKGDAVIDQINLSGGSQIIKR